MTSLETTVIEVKQKLDAGEPLVLLDCREPFETDLCRLANAELIPMNTIPQRLAEVERLADRGTLVVYCHHGMRSLNVANWLRQQGVENVTSMTGGIDAWSLQIDRLVPRY
ncbi:MAG: rhodanese [Bryobacteraceae bacterium]|nr:rhodanese [Bryobacteraceae bacterium]